MEGLNLDNILDEDALSLFNNIEETETPEEETTEGEETKESKNEKTTEIDPNSLFGSGESESVGSERDNEEQEDTLSEGDGTSPKNPDFFSSIAEAFAEEGILPNLDEETIKGIKTPEDFRKAIDEYLRSELDEQQRRVAEALDNNVEPSQIRQYEGVINYLDGISEEQIREESDNGEELRKRIMFQDYINKGFSKQRAQREVERSTENGTDVDDALEALQECKKFYKDGYQGLLQQAKEARAREEEERNQRGEKLKKDILDTKNTFFDGLNVDLNTRKKVLDTLIKPIYKDPKTGEVYTALQKYELDHSDDFFIKMGLLFTLTDGFKSLDKLVGSKVKKGIKKGLRDLEDKINNTSRDSYGNLQFASGVSDEESYLGKGIRLAL